MELKEIVETLQKAQTKIKVQEEAIKHYKEDVKDLEQQQEILKLALELACEKVTNDFGVDSDEIIYKKWFNTFYNAFIEKAQEKLKGGKV